MAVFTAIGAAIFGAGTLLAGVSAAALQIAAGIAINYFTSSLNGQPEQQYAGMQGQLQVGADVSRTVPFGLNLAEHSMVYANYWGTADGTPNAYLSQVFCAADYPVKGLHEIYIDGARVTLLADDGSGKGRPVSEYQRDGQNYAWVKFYDGTQTAADPFLVATFGGHPERPYGANRVGYGCPYVILTTRVHEELWSGFPTVKIVLDGARLYDISRDSTRGGVGTQRANNPATWGGDGDYLTAVQAYTLLMGVRFNGQWLYGLQSLPAAQLPDAWWVAQVNACRATVTGPAGPEATYRSGGSINVSRPISETMQSLTTACQGRLVEVGGEYRLHVGGAQAPVYHITDGDVVSTEERRFVPFFGLADTINGIAASHPSPENGWNPLPLPTLLRPDLEAIDGGRRLLASVSLDLVPYEWQAQRVMQQALAEARRERKLTLVLPGGFYMALPGEWISFTSADNGFIDKLFRIDGAAYKANGDVMWDITEIDPADYDPDFGTYTPPVVGPLVPGVVPTQVIIGWSVTADYISDELGAPRRPALRFFWDGAVDDVRSVALQVRVRDTAALIFSDSHDMVRDGTVKVAAQSFLPNMWVQARGRYISASGTAPQAWGDWLDAQLPDIKLDARDVVFGDIDLDELGEQAKGLFDWMGNNVRDLIEQAEAQAVLTGDQELANAMQFDEMRRTLSVVTETLSATFEETITTAIIPMNGQLVALADALTELSAADEGNVNTARIRFTALSGPAGYSRVGIETRYETDNPSDFRLAGSYWDTPNDPGIPTRRIEIADQFVIASSLDDITFQPFIFEDGEAKMMAARIGTIRAGRLESFSGTSFFDLTNNALRVST